ncbi:unnamed protein product [Heterobilharzia americana]|nr:unnamed protein product [Heterobilharzia americana]
MNNTDPLCVQLLKSLVLCSEKAAVIARLIKQQTGLFQTLIQVKDSAEANLRFSVDVKTLTDVLIQEVVKYDLGLLFPGFGDLVFGEENNRFSGNSGKTVTIQLSSKENLVNVFVDIFGNNVNFANELSEICFQSLELFKTQLSVSKIWENLITKCNSLCQIQDKRYNDPKEFGVWIDPIDSTADYAQGQFDKIHASASVVESSTEAESLNQINHFFANPTSLIRFFRGGLINVTILIGLFDRSTGLPLIGVVNQPFYLLDNLSQDDNSSLDNKVNTLHNYGRIFWGFNVNTSENFSPIIGSSNRVFSEGKPVLKLACSSVEFSRLANLFHNYKDENQELVNVVLLSSSGAGFKQLCVILNEVDAFILMEPNTFVWDTCGPHTIISSLGGGIIQLKTALDSVKTLLHNITDNLDSVRQTILNDLNKFQIIYNVLKSPEEIQMLNSPNLSKCCNRNGLLAYRNPMLASQLLVHIALNQN